MKKYKLHILTVFFSIILLTLLSFGASAEDAPTEDYLTKTVDYVEYHLYETEGEKVAVAYKFVGNKEVTELNILSEVDGYKVKSVDTEFNNNTDFSSITVVNIGENIETLDEIISSIKMTNLKKVNLPASITKIGNYDFYGCKNLEEINLENIQHIGLRAFMGCTNLKSVNFSEKLESIAVSAFEESGLETVTIPAKAELSYSPEIESSGAQFRKCKNLKTVVFEDRADENKTFFIDTAAFAVCTSLKKIVLPQNVEKIVVSQGAFLDCENLKSFDFSNVISIYDMAFENCKNLTKVNFSDNLEVIGCHAFAGTGIKTVTIPSKASLECEMDPDGDHMDDMFPYEDWGGQFRDCKNLKTVVFEDKEKSKLYIPYYTFTNCTSLKKVYLPDDIKITVAMRAFKNCKSLTKVYGSESIVEIGDAAFSYCKSLKEITLGKNLKTVGEKAFLGCSKLARVNLEGTKTAPTFGRKAFSATADGIKFVADKAIAKKVKTNLKNTATKNAKVYSVAYSKI